MSRTFSTLAALTVVAGLGSYALASHEQEFKRLDTNGDGKLTMAEYAAGKTGDAKTKAEEEFKSLDANGDGSLNLEEYAKAKPEKKESKKD